MTNLTVVIPTLKKYKQGLEYLKNYFKGRPYRIVLVDNSRKNLGFAPAVNKGAKGARTKWLLILNDDIKFYDDNTLERLIKEAEVKKLDALSPTLINPGGRMENVAYKILLNGSIAKGNIKKNDFDGLTAACLLIKTAVFEELGGFDEEFFVSLEDVEFFLRFKKAGYKMGVSSIKVFHNHMTTTSTMGNFKARQDMINWWRLYLKHPDRFKLNLDFIVERLRNVSGFIKASIKS
ncbi:glycosyltransferase [Patescibacteria group bacterium]|nr:glycosyltransferase [Patescibacteria group bacterium]